MSQTPQGIPSYSTPFLQRLLPFIKLSISLVIIAWFVQNQKINFSVLAPLFTSNYLLVCLVCIFLNLFFCSERWRLLVRSQNIHLSLTQSFKYTLVGQFFNFTVPGGMGGDIIKALYMNKQFPDSKLVNAYSVFFDRVIGIFSLSLLGLMGTLVNPAMIFSSPTLTSLFYANLTLSLGIMFGCGLLVFKKETIAKLCTKLPYLKKMNSPLAFKFDFKAVLKCISLGLASQSVLIIFFYVVGEIMLPNQVDWRCCFFVVPLGMIAAAVPIAPAGVGVGQAALYFLFNTYVGFTSEFGPTGATFMQMLLFLYSVIGTAWFYLEKRWLKT